MDWDWSFCLEEKICGNRSNTAHGKSNQLFFKKTIQKRHYFPLFSKSKGIRNILIIYLIFHFRLHVNPFSFLTSSTIRKYSVIGKSRSFGKRNYFTPSAQDVVIKYTRKKMATVIGWAVNSQMHTNGKARDVNTIRIRAHNGEDRMHERSSEISQSGIKWRENETKVCIRTVCSLLKQTTRVLLRTVA